MEAELGRKHSTPPPPESAAPMEGKKQKKGSTQSAAASAAVISSVLGNDDLLREILLRLAFPTNLVRSVLVCRRWLRAASDPVFLHRFRDLHPPRLLGFYVSSIHRRWRVEFVPMLPQPPELDAVLRRARFTLESYGSPFTRIMDCRNGRVVVGLYHGGQLTYRVQTPLHPARDIVVFPALPVVDGRDNRFYNFNEVLSKEGENGLSYFWLLLDYNQEQKKATVSVYMLQDDAWRLHTTATTQLTLQGSSSLRLMSIFLVDDKIYMGIAVQNILVLDLTSSTFFTIGFPDRMVLNSDVMLSRANGAGVYLVHVNDLQLYIWLHRGGDGGMADWLLVDTICLRDMCATLRMSNGTTEDGNKTVVNIHAMGENAEFVFLEMNRCVFYLDVRSRALQKVYEVSEKNIHVFSIHPFMMNWPPIFPVLKE